MAVALADPRAIRRIHTRQYVARSPVARLVNIVPHDVAIFTFLMSAAPLTSNGKTGSATMVLRPSRAAESLHGRVGGGVWQDLSEPIVGAAAEEGSVPLREVGLVPETHFMVVLPKPAAAGGRSTKL